MAMSRREFWFRPAVQRAATVGAAATSAVILWAGSGGHPAVQSGTIGAGAVLATSVIAGLAGWALLALLERATRRPLAIWLATATVVYLLSLLAAVPAAANASSAGTLIGLHSVVFAALVAGFWRGQRVAAACAAPSRA
jgi:hypothetical protein